VKKIREDECQRKKKGAAGKQKGTEEKKDPPGELRSEKAIPQKYKEKGGP